jgi:hypothetical protein
MAPKCPEKPADDAVLSEMHRKSEETVIRSYELMERTRVLLAQSREIIRRKGRSPCEKSPEHDALHKRSRGCSFGDE